MERKCPRCGSEKIARGAQMLDAYGYTGVFNAPAEARVFGKPGVFFRKGYRGEMNLDVCGDCGHGEITVTNYRELYKAFLEAEALKKK